MFSPVSIASRGALTAGGLGAAQDPQKLWGIWSKILTSSNFQALHSNFRKVLFFKTDYMIFTEFYTKLGINFEKNVDFNSAYLFVRTPRTPPPPWLRLCQLNFLDLPTTNTIRYNIYILFSSPELKTQFSFF